MKFRKNKIKREHSIIDGALDWLEDLSKKKEVSDIIPGVIDVTNTPGKSIVYKYETPTGCKILLKSGGSLQEAFVVTQQPQVVQTWVEDIMEELELLGASIDRDEVSFKMALEESLAPKKTKTAAKSPGPAKKRTNPAQPHEEKLLQERVDLLRGIKEDYQLVEINQGLRDSYLESLACAADLDNPKLEEALDPGVRQALEGLQESLQDRNGPRSKPAK